MLHLTDLGEDIIVTAVCLFLTPVDRFHLSLTCKQINQQLTTNDAYRRLYLTMFGNSIPLNLENYNWKSLFMMRSSKSLNVYTWGSADQGRLGYLLNDVPRGHRSLYLLGVHTPTLIPNFTELAIEQVLAGGFSFQLLVNGNIYCTGLAYTSSRDRMSAPGPPEKDYAPLLTTGHATSNYVPFQRVIETWSGNLDEDNRELTPGLRNSSSTAQEPHATIESRFVTRMKLPVTAVKDDRRVKLISSGRQHFLALDNAGTVYTWDSGNADWTMGVKVTFPGLLNKISKIFAGWSLSVCLMIDIGLVVWRSRESVTQRDYEGGTNQAAADYFVIPGLSQAVDFVALSDCVIFIQGDGDLRCFNMSGSPQAGRNRDAVEYSHLVHNFNGWLSNFNKVNNTEAIFTKLCGNYESFAVFSNLGLVLLGHRSNLVEGSHEPPSLIPDLQERGIIEVVMGDYHYLALTDSGNLLGWGLELQNRGCLGLGALSEENQESAQPEGNNWRVYRPELVAKPAPAGKWMAVVAAGWHSGGLFVPDEATKS